MENCDLFLGLSKGGIVSKKMVKSMAEKPLIFALANPDPEILPDDVLDVRGDAIVATGRSDYPNQINNVLGFLTYLEERLMSELLKSLKI